MYTPFAYALAYAIKQTPYAFVAKIILCMYLLYGLVGHERKIFLPMVNNLFRRYARESTGHVCDIVGNVYIILAYISIY